MRKRLLTFALLACVSGEYLMGGYLDNTNARPKSRPDKIEDSSALERRTHLDDLDLDLVAEESTVVAVAGATAKTDDEDYENAQRYHIPYPFAFNGGKPFSLEKDPITGKIDFEKAPPVKALNYTSRYQEDKKSDNDDDSENSDEEEDAQHAEREKITNKDNVDVGPNEINTYTPNFHDFLNLPVHYSSDKYKNNKYPLISSSYANTKVQSGANSYVYNHKPYHPENDVRPTKNPYTSMTKTSTYRTTTVHDFEAKWTTARPSTTSTTSTTTTKFSTKAPVITTWKPPSIPTAFHSIDRPKVEDEKNILPIEKLHASESHRRPGNEIATRSPNRQSQNEAPMKEQNNATRYKDQPIPNFVLSHARPETKPPAQDEEYAYDIYEIPESEVEDEDEENHEETDYYSPYQELLKQNVTSRLTTSTTTSRPTTTTIAATTTISTTTSTTTTSATVTAGTTISAAPSVTPSRSTFSTPPAYQKNTSNPLQFPKVPQHPTASSSFNNEQSVTEHHGDIINHGYRPNWMIKPDGPGTVLESTSNIVIPPDQDTVSFVLGNRQNVDGYYSVGSAVGENPYGSSSDIQTSWPLRHEQQPQLPPKDVKHELVTELSPQDRVTQKWRLPGSNVLKTSNEVDLVRTQDVAPTNTVIHDTKENKEKNPGYVVFPDDDEVKNKNPPIEEHIVIINEADGSIRELPPKTTTTTMTNKTISFPSTGGDSLPQLAEDLMPPAESSKPPFYFYHYQFDNSPRPDHLRPPLPPRVKVRHPPGLSPVDAGLRKRPYSPDAKLPNILPQFRPNAKASHGHRGPDGVGTMPAGQGLPPRIRQPLPASHQSSRRPLPPPLSYLQRLNPPPPPIHAIRMPPAPTSKVDSSVALPHEIEPTIRRFRPPYGGSPISRGGSPGAGQEERNAGGEDEGDDSRKEEERIESKDERENDSSERYPEEPPMTPPKPPIFLKRGTSDHLRVATLQMIQHHGELDGENDDDKITETAQPADPAYEAEHRKSDNHDSTEMAEQPVYVVYPVTTAVNIYPDDSNEKDGSVVVGTRGSQRPLPPDTLLQDEQEKTQYNNRPVVPDFPYSLERPDPSSVFPVPSVKETPLLVPSDQRQKIVTASETVKNEQDAVNVIPYLQDFLPFRKKNDAAISVTLHRASPSTTSASTALTSTATPIAYVYTPTHSAHHLDDEEDAEVDAKQTVLLPSQQPSSSSSSAPAPQNFMAPFVPSLSAEAPSRNGWSVVVVDPSEGAERKKDGDSDDAASSDVETQTEKEFDPDNFKPQLFGGFKPIYEFPSGDTGSHDAADANTEMNMPRRSKKLSPVT